MQENNEIVSSNSQAQSEQRNIKLIVAGAVIVALVVWRGWIALTSVEDVSVEKEQIRIFKNDDMVQTKFLGEVAPELKAQKEDVKRLQKAQEEQSALIEELLKQIQNPQKNSADEFKDAKQEFEAASYPPPFYGLQNQNQNQQSGAVEEKEPVKSVKIENLQESMIFDIKKNDDNKTKSGEIISRGKENIILAPGVLIKARLITGVRAPTLTKAVNEPQPVFLKVTDLAILPNRGKLNIKECVIKAEAKGDLATESVFIRTNFLSCTTETGDVLISKLSASVYGTSGANGIAGVVVSKQGALLGRSLIAGFVDGFSRMSRMQYQSVLSSSMGTMVTNDMSGSELVKGGAYSGVSQAGQQMSKFYMDMVKQIEPSVEIKPNIDVDVMVTDVSIIEFKKEGDKK